MRSQIIQFVTGPDVYIASTCASNTAQQRFVLNQTTGQVSWDVHGIRHRVNAIVNIDNTITVGGTKPVSGAAVYSFVTSALSGLTPTVNVTQLFDVHVSNSSQSQALAYNSVSSKWQNKTIQQTGSAVAWAIYT